MERLRLAVVGTGDVAHRDYLPEAHRLADAADVVAVCGQSEARARSTAEEYDIPRWYTDVGDLLRLEPFDALINLTSHEAHFEVSLAALQAGKHLYTEKPLALSVGRARALRDEAARRGLVLVCAPSVMVFPQVTRARSMVASGAIGTVFSARGRSLAGVPPWPGFMSDPSHYFEADVGPLPDLAVYPLHALTGILGPAHRVMAMSRRTRNEFLVSDGPAAGKRVAVKADDDWHLLVDCGEALVSIEANYCALTALGPECELMGDRGAVAFSLFDGSAPISVATEDGNRLEEDVPHERVAGPDHILGVRHLVDCVREQRYPLANAEHAIHVLEIVEAARRSAETGGAVEVLSAFPVAPLAEQVNAHGR
jgi:predicted dehydrogenase